MSKSDILKTKAPSRHLTWDEAMEIAQEAMPTQRCHWNSYARTLIEMDKMDKMDVSRARHKERKRKEQLADAHLDQITLRAVEPCERFYVLLAKAKLTTAEEVELELLVADAEARADAMLGKED